MIIIMFRCSSVVGRRGTGPTSINLADSCTGASIVAHEMFHAFGRHHEQSRPDRDTYVTIHWDNIRMFY